MTLAAESQHAGGCWASPITGRKTGCALTLAVQRCRVVRHVTPGPSAGPVAPECTPQHSEMDRPGEQTGEVHRFGRSSQGPASIVAAGAGGASRQPSYSQAEITEALTRLLNSSCTRDRCGVFIRPRKLSIGTRAAARGIPPAADFGQTNTLFLEHAVNLCSDAVSAALETPVCGPRMLI